MIFVWKLRGVVCSLMLLGVAIPARSEEFRSKDLLIDAKLLPQGQYYQATVPDTLDLADRARLSLRILTNNIKDCNLLQKDARAIPLLRTMCGSREYLEQQKGIVGPLVDQVLSYAARRSSSKVFYVGPGLGISISFMPGYYEQTGDRRWLEVMRRGGEQLAHDAIRVQDRAYYPPESWPDANGVWRFADERGKPRIPYTPPDEPYLDQQGFEGDVKWENCWALRGWVRIHECTHEPQWLEMAQKLRRFLMKPTMWEQPNDPVRPGYQHGIWGGHFHANMGTLQGLLDLAVATNDYDLKRIVREGYEHALANGIVRMGWFPCWTTPEKYGRPGWLLGENEACAVADLMILAVKLTDAGLGDYWDDVDSIVRNHLTELQFADEDRLVAVGGEAARSYLGGFQQVKLTANPIRIHNCCSANGAIGLYFAWHGITRFDNGVARVNLLLNRASKWMDVDSYLPYEGKVVLHNKLAHTAEVRVPRWVDWHEVKRCVNEVPVTAEYAKGYLVFKQLKPSDVIRLEFPVPTRTEKHFIYDKTYTVTFKGSTVVDIQPRDTTAGLYPLYHREKMKGNQAPMKSVTRFATEKEFSLR